MQPGKYPALPAPGGQSFFHPKIFSADKHISPVPAQQIPGGMRVRKQPRAMRNPQRRLTGNSRPFIESIIQADSLKQKKRI